MCTHTHTHCNDHITMFRLMYNSSHRLTLYIPLLPSDVFHVNTLYFLDQMEEKADALLSDVDHGLKQ